MRRYFYGLWLLGIVLVHDASAREVSQLVAECEACHGPAGISGEEDVPSLAGKSVTYLREVLDQFTNYERHCRTTTYRHGDRAKTPMTMCNVANSLSEDEKQAVAEYFAGAQDPAAANQ